VTIDGLKVPVISPVGLVLLKLVAWSDRHWTHPMKDAADLAYVIRHYGTILTEEVLFDEYIDAIEASEYDVDLAANRVLGRKIASLVGKVAGDFILNLLENELRQETDSQLVRDIRNQTPGVDTEHVYALLQSLKAGLIEEMNK
jgi:predicted nucleotidyltransferase